MKVLPVIVGFILGVTATTLLNSGQSFSGGAATATATETAECPPCSQVQDCSTCPATKTVCDDKPQSGTTNTTTMSEADKFSGIRDQINNICAAVLAKGKDGHKFVPWTTFMFCQTHKMVFRRTWLYPAATTLKDLRSFDTKNDNSLAPFQMAMQQYMGIALTAAQIPRMDYTVQPLRKKPGRTPRILFIGCGKDTTFWQGTADFLGGEIVFVDFYENWAKLCAVNYQAETVLFVNITGNFLDQFGILEDLAKVDKKNNFLHLVSGDERYHQFALELSDEILRKPWDIIVVDAPSATNEGRAKPLYSAFRIALSQPKETYCRIYLHDTNRPRREQVIARAFASFHPSVFLGDHMPRKGLYEWRVEGMSIPYNATTE